MTFGLAVFRHWLHCCSPFSHLALCSTLAGDYSGTDAAIAPIGSANRSAAGFGATNKRPLPPLGSKTRGYHLRLRPAAASRSGPAYAQGSQFLTFPARQGSDKGLGSVPVQQQAELNAGHDILLTQGATLDSGAFSVLWRRPPGVGWR